MKCYRRMLKIVKTHRNRNEELLERLHKHRTVINIKIRKLEYLEHEMRGDKYYARQNSMKESQEASPGRAIEENVSNVLRYNSLKSNEIFDRRVTYKDFTIVKLFIIMKKTGNKYTFKNWEFSVIYRTIQETCFNVNIFATNYKLSSYGIRNVW